MFEREIGDSVDAIHRIFAAKKLFHTKTNSHNTNTRMVGVSNKYALLLDYELNLCFSKLLLFEVNIEK